MNKSFLIIIKHFVIISTIRNMDASVALIDPFAKNLLDWKDELRLLQPIIPNPEKDLSKQPRSDKKVKQNRDNKNVLSIQVK